MRARTVQKVESSEGVFCFSSPADDLMSLFPQELQMPMCGETSTNRPISPLEFSQDTTHWALESFGPWITGFHPA